MKRPPHRPRTPRQVGPGPELAVSLRDGTPVLIRPVRPEDRARMRGGFARLSARSRQQRFFRGLTALADADLDYLTCVDQHDHVAWGGTDPTYADRPGLGMGRFVRADDDPTMAEMGIAVVDDFQGRGLGTLLLAALTLRAEAEGIETLRALTLLENDAVSHWLRGLGAAMHFDGLVCDFRLPVVPPPPPADLKPSKRRRRGERPGAGSTLAWYQTCLRELRPFLLGTPPAPLPDRASRPRRFPQR